MSKRVPKFLTLATTLSWALIIAACANPDSNGGPGTASSDAPLFRVETFDGSRFVLADHRGTPVVINFWESW